MKIMIEETLISRGLIKNRNVLNDIFYKVSSNKISEDGKHYTLNYTSNTGVPPEKMLYYHQRLINKMNKEISKINQ